MIAVSPMEIFSVKIPKRRGWEGKKVDFEAPRTRNASHQVMLVATRIRFAVLPARCGARSIWATSCGRKVLDQRRWLPLRGLEKRSDLSNLSFVRFFLWEKIVVIFFPTFFMLINSTKPRSKRSASQPGRQRGPRREGNGPKSCGDGKVPTP